LVLGEWVKMIPMPALVAIMIMVSVGTFSWSSLTDMIHHPRRSSIVMLATVATVVGTHNLALGVGVGVLLSGIFFAWKVSQIFRVRATITADGRSRTYYIEGEVFFASADDLLEAFDFKEDIDNVVIDVTHAHIWDLTGVGAIDMAVLKFRRDGKMVEVFGLNEASATIMDKLGVHNDPQALERMFAH
ncbi:MAG: STAS domain-containing protein, partial [Alphaproteobacteria bacterium]|nr:STAS domain-containing protein [Alphaproteobacteria bacterium]